MAKVTGGRVEVDSTAVKVTGGNIRETVTFEETTDTGASFDANDIAYVEETGTKRQLTGSLALEYRDDEDSFDDPPDMRPGQQVTAQLYTSGRSGARYYDGTINIKSADITFAAAGVTRWSIEWASHGSYTYE